MVAAPMIVFVLTAQAPPILVLTLLLLVYLTIWDLRPEDDLAFLHKAWWTLFVFLTHILGYAALRIWLATRRARARRA
jgi:hypothetical protein